MENKKLIRIRIFLSIIVIILGIFLHFTYEISNKNKFVALFSAVNESVWEHLKLVFFPIIITSLIEYVYIGKKKVSNYICSVIKGIITSMSFIVVFFYTYTGIIGKNFVVLDIGSFLISVILGEYIIYKNIQKNNKCNKNIYGITGIIIMILFFIFTFKAPKINLFKDPIIGEYGITIK